MAFMEPVIEEGPFWEVEDFEEVPGWFAVELFSKEEAIEAQGGTSAKKVGGYLVYLSAPGYLDRTDPEWFATLAEANERYDELEAELEEEDEDWED